MKHKNGGLKKTQKQTYPSFNLDFYSPKKLHMLFYWLSSNQEIFHDLPRKNGGPVTLRWLSTLLLVALPELAPGNPNGQNAMFLNGTFRWMLWGGKGGGNVLNERPNWSLSKSAPTWRIIHPMTWIGD